MKLIDLCGFCTMQNAKEDSKMVSCIPGSVAATLLENGKIPDPYYRDNEEKVLPVFDEDYVFRKEFSVCEENLAHDRLYLTCEGLDTICDITLNGEKLGSAKNMFVKYRFDVKERLRVGQNVLEFYFHSPRRYLAEHKVDLGKPFHVIRKAGCMFGWDWGINLPDSGVWKPCYIEGFDIGEIVKADIEQEHHPEKVVLRINTVLELWKQGEISAVLYDDAGNLLCEKNCEAKQKNTFTFEITNPKLWWPNGYGSQPLYHFEVQLLSGGTVVDALEKEIGLRTVKLNREKDKKGHKYEFVVNGTPVYVKGESLVIHDAVISRSTEEKWKQLIDNCIRSNLNCIRVWGGAYYPPDLFYELCDRYGILVYQDFMFACTFYYPSESFMESVRTEVEQQIVRLRDHPCVCVFCGNNELDCIYTAMTSKEPETMALRRQFGAGNAFDLKTRFFIRHIYSKIFLKLIPEKCRELAPQISYTHSSPTAYRPLSAKSIYDYLNDGDMHYYLQYNGNAPYQKMREINCRFMSELGFQSYPSIKTIRTFALEKDMGPYTKVMYAHQKCKNGNETIEEYLQREYKVPQNFEDYVYLSQLQAAEIMGYSVEHMRRHSDFNRGIIIWQLNDCWPVCSWAGIDYYGRWKAQQYYTKRFYEPVLVSAEDKELVVDFYVICDGVSGYEGKIIWSLETDREVLLSGEKEVHITKNSREMVMSLDFSGYREKKKEMYLRYYLSGQEDKGIKTLLFCPCKEFAFSIESPLITVGETEEVFYMNLSSEKLVKGLMLDLHEGDAIFSDNFFDLKGKRRILVQKSDCSIGNLTEFKNQLFVKSLNEVMVEK